MAVTKFSRQRESIKNFLKATTTHPTADMVYSTLREQYPNISLGTVYRNLNFLVENGEIIRLSCGDGSEHFDGNPIPHNHFICQQCKQVYDLVMEPIDHINLIAGANFDGEIKGHVTYFYGICKQCKEKQEI